MSAEWLRDVASEVQEVDYLGPDFRQYAVVMIHPERYGDLLRERVEIDPARVTPLGLFGLKVKVEHDVSEEFAHVRLIVSPRAMREIVERARTQSSILTPPPPPSTVRGLVREWGKRIKRWGR